MTLGWTTERPAQVISRHDREPCHHPPTVTATPSHTCAETASSWTLTPKDRRGEGQLWLCPLLPTQEAQWRLLRGSLHSSPRVGPATLHGSLENRCKAREGTPGQEASGGVSLAEKARCSREERGWGTLSEGVHCAGCSLSSFTTHPRRRAGSRHSRGQLPGTWHSLWLSLPRSTWSCCRSRR